MPRPKGSKNRKPSVRRKGVANAESISEAKAAVATQIEALTSEVNEAAAALKAKKAELKDAQKQLAKIEKQDSKNSLPPDSTPDGRLLYASTLFFSLIIGY